MPLSLAGGYLIGAGINALTGFANRESQKGQNAKDRDFQIQMYNLQRKHALEDWSREAEYNSPIQQMERLRQAGLNPNLVYGKGADNTMRSVRSSQANTPNQTAPQLQLDTAKHIMGYAQIRNIQANTDATSQLAAVRKQEALLKDAQTATELSRGNLTKEQALQLRGIRDYIIEEARLNNEKKKADIAYTLDENERRELMNTTNVQLSIEKILSERINRAKTQKEIDKLKATIELVKKDDELKRLHINLAKDGIYPGDPLYLRIIAQILAERFDINLGDLVPDYPDSTLKEAPPVNSTPKF